VAAIIVLIEKLISLLIALDQLTATFAPPSIPISLALCEYLDKQC
jgi:hypothetical protein